MRAPLSKNRVDRDEAFYDRLVAAGKPKKVAIIASMRKLLGAIMSVARTKTPFVPRALERSRARGGCGAWAERREVQ
ncbi:MAG: hypothetical protein KC586_09330, partial [Myxococcales bacterium]|nr:hypothetical protein [Myxococcales bacterium]